MEIVILFIIIFFIWKAVVGKKKSEEKINTFTKNFNEKTEKSVSVIETNIYKAKKAIEKSISKSYITGSSWLQTNNTEENVLYTFRNNGELLITTNGIVKKATYELIIDNNSILISKNNITEHFNIVNVKNDFLYLNKVSSDVIIILANQTKFKDEIKSNLNRIAKQYQDFELDQNLEREKYKTLINEDYYNSFYDNCKTWKEGNSDKGVYEYIDYIELEAKKVDIHYEIWEKYNPNQNRIKFGEYLASRNIHGLK